MKSITCLLLLLAVCASAPSLVEANRRQARRAKTSELEMDSMETPATLPVAPMFNSVSDKVAGKGRSGRRGVQKPVVPVESRKYQGDTVRGSSSAGLTDFPAISQVPVNDLCSDAITVPCGGGVALTSLGVELANPPSLQRLLAFAVARTRAD